MLSLMKINKNLKNKFLSKKLCMYKINLMKVKNSTLKLLTNQEAGKFLFIVILLTKKVIIKSMATIGY